jgi:hypothetical protein
LGKIAHRTGFGHGSLLTQRSTGVHQWQQKLMEAMFTFIGVTRQYAAMIRLKAPIWVGQINTKITPTIAAVQRKISHLMAAIAGPIGPPFSQGLTGVAETERQRLTRAMFRFIGVTQQYVEVVRLRAALCASQIRGWPRRPVLYTSCDLGRRP